MTFAARLLEQADTVVVPGAGFSPERGRDWFRIALTVEAERMGEAVDRMRRIDWTH
jgi:LL-diaminopimelate aminotransferase